jgi:hypothetical protein
VSLRELIQYYESLVGRQEELPEEATTPILRQFAANLRDALEARVILRDLRNRAGIASCSGEVDCVETPTALCMKGAHPTCPAHADRCYLCPLAKLEESVS